MPIDSSIYLQQQAPDILGNLQQGLKMRDMMTQQKMQQRALQKDQNIEDAYKAGIVTNPDGSTKFDSKLTLGSLAASGNGKEYMGFQSEVNAQDAAQEKLKQEKQLHHTTLVAQLAGTVTDQLTYDRALQRASQEGLDISQLPKGYDAGYVKQLQMQALSAKERLDLQFKQQDSDIKQQGADLDKKKFGLEQQKFSLDKQKASGAGGFTEGRKAVDKDYAKDYNDWTSTGRTSLDKNLERLKEAKSLLEKDKTLTGSLRGLAPDWVRNSTNEDAIKTRDNVRAAAQGALKATLGSAFTEKEGERIMNQAYNEKLSPEANIEKIDAAIKELETNTLNNERKVKHFQKHGTLSGLDNSAPVSNGKVFKTSEIEW